VDPVDENGKDEGAWRAEPIDHIANGRPVLNRHVRSVASRIRGKEISHRAKTDDRDLHNGFPTSIAKSIESGGTGTSPRHLLPYFSMGTPTKLPYSVHDPS